MSICIIIVTSKVSTIFKLAAHGFACVYACDLDDRNFDGFISESKEQYPSTEVVIRCTIDYQVIGYRYDTASKENTLKLIDDILNLWGKITEDPSGLSNMLQPQCQKLVRNEIIQTQLRSPPHTAQSSLSHPRPRFMAECGDRHIPRLNTLFWGQ